MNHCELQALRKMLMIDVSEAAQYIGKVSARTWQYWESAKYKIPKDVESSMKELAQKRNKLIAKLKEENEVQGNDNQNRSMPYYRTFEEYLEKNQNTDIISWRIHQSAVAFIFAGLHISLR